MRDLDAATNHALDAVARARVFDHHVIMANLELVEQYAGHEVSELVWMLAADVGQALAALLQGDVKATRAFLIRVAATSRYLAVDHPELQGVEAMR